MKSCPKNLLIAIALAGVLTAACPVSAQIVEYTTQASYNAATLSDAVVTFDGSSGGTSSYSYGDPGTYTVGQVTFSTVPGTELFAAGPNAFTLPNDATGTLDPQADVAGTTASLLASLPTLSPFSLTAVGTQIGSFTPSTVTAIVSLANHTSQTFTYSVPNETISPGLGFLGFTSGGSAITSVYFIDTPPQGDFADFTLDNFTYGIATAPEPASYVLLILGAIGFCAFFRRGLLAR